MWERINKILKGQIVTSVLYTLLGLCFILMPVNTVNIICKFVFGVVLILAGAYHILIYVLEKINATLLDLLSGGMLLVIGIFLFYNPQIVVKLLPVLLGTFVLADSIWVLKGGVRLKKSGRSQWRFLVFGSLIFIVPGIAMIIDPFDMVKYTVIFAGAVMLANGVFDIVFMILMRRGLKQAEKAAEEAVELAKAAEADNRQKEEKTEQPEYAPWSSRTGSENTERFEEKPQEDADPMEEPSFGEVQEEPEKKEPQEGETGEVHIVE